MTDFERWDVVNLLGRKIGGLTEADRAEAIQAWFGA